MFYALHEQIKMKLENLLKGLGMFGRIFSDIMEIL